MQTLLIRQPECNNLFTFGWGDMPYQGEHDGYYEDLTAHPISTRMTLLPESFFRSASQNKNARKRRRIRFAELAQVRTHETILGDHPVCSDGLALQCGWAYAETEYTPLSAAGEKKVRRLDQMTRRQRLREVTGMSHVQLLQVANQFLDHYDSRWTNR
jgi:hypothetical protein